MENEYTFDPMESVKKLRKERKEKNMEKKKLVDYIGEAALLEQVAEECNELSFACLKLARMMRGENKVHGRTKQGLLDDVHEEIADVMVSVDELSNSSLIDKDTICKWMDSKEHRMQERLSKENSRKEAALKFIEESDLTDAAKESFKKSINSGDQTDICATIVAICIMEQMFPGSVFKKDETEEKHVDLDASHETLNKANKTEENSRKEDDDNCVCKQNDISKKHLTDRAKKELYEGVATDSLAARMIPLSIAERMFPGSVITED